MRSDDFWRGYREASRAAVTELRKLANTMNDPDAKRVIDAAGHHAGLNRKRGSEDGAE